LPIAEFAAYNPDCIFPISISSREELEEPMLKTRDCRVTGMVFVTVGCVSLLLSRAKAQTIDWSRQLGSGSHEDAIAVSADGAGYVYIAGETNGSLGGSSAGGSDAFIAKFDAAGNLAWTGARGGVPNFRQIGTSAADHGYGVSADGLGNVYMSGITSGNLGGTNAGGIDAFVSKWDPAGTLLWTRQLGTAADDYSYGVSADGMGNVYISGFTNGSLDGVHTGTDAFLTKYDAAGTLVWTRQSGFANSDASFGVSADRLGNIFMSGDVSGQAFVSKYDAVGTLSWTQQFGSRGGVDCRGVSADGSGNVYITGTSDSSLTGNGGSGQEVFISKFDALGTRLWTRQILSNTNDSSLGVSADDLGNVYITGGTGGNLGGAAFGNQDAFVAKYDSIGNLLWIKQFGTSSFERSLAVSADHLGNVYAAGGTEGSLGAPNRGFGDAFVVKINDMAAPEPTTGALFILAGLSFSCRRRRIGCC
jgi:hypothetical protein